MGRVERVDAIAQLQGEPVVAVDAEGPLTGRRNRDEPRGFDDEIVHIAKLHPKFQEVSNSVDPENKEKVEKAVKNSKKKVSSASITGSGGSRTVNENDLTCEQIGKLSVAQYSKLSKKTRIRGLKGIEP